MYFYRLNDKTLFSMAEYKNLDKTTEQEASRDNKIIYALKNLDPKISRRSFAVNHPSLLFIENEGLNLLTLNSSSSYKLPKWLLTKINNGQVTAINTNYKDWQKVLNTSLPSKWRINIAGLGDVGGTLLMGLRLLGADCIEEIGIYDRDFDKLKRWEFEANQISSIEEKNRPNIKILKEEEVFDCDLFAFCIATRVPAVGEEKKDVRMVQFEGNSKIVNIYANMAKKANFKGIFAVVSDPVDLLCKSAYLASNTDLCGNFDFNGLYPEQIRGYGLGVMNARALYYANKSESTSHFSTEGRVFGPHGSGLIVADSIQNYNQELSINLTEKTKNANLELRKTGFKPYIAPALSSGALSILSTIKGEWHYSATFMGGVYMGAKNRLTKQGTEIEMLDLPDSLYSRLKNTYNELSEIL